MSRLDHLQEAEVAVAQVTAILPEARIFPDMMKLETAPYVCIHAESLVLLLLVAGARAAA